jgi:hypothetical protein
MSNTIHLTMPIDAPRVLAVPRKLWLAGLGAAAYARSWVESEAGGVFHALVREGVAVETRAMRYVGRNMDASLARARGFARSARHGIDALGRVASQIRDKLPTVRAGLAVESATKSSSRKAKPARGRAVKRKVASVRTRAKH